MVKIMLDPGHDINTPGKRALDGSMREFEFNKEVALKVGHLLQQYENVEVVFSHDLNDGVDTSLAARADLANALKVDALVSIHANAGPSSARGIETYVHLNAPESTQRLGQMIQDNLIKTTGQVDRKLKKADFAILRETHMHAVLAECGFMTNEQDLALLKDDGYRGQCAEGNVNGLAQFFGLKKKEIVTVPTPVFTVAARDFSSEEEAHAFANFVRTTQYGKIGLYIERLR